MTAKFKRLMGMKDAAEGEMIQLTINEIVLILSIDFSPS